VDYYEDDPDTPRRGIPLSQVWVDIRDRGVDPHDIVRRWRLSGESAKADEIATWLEQCWAEGGWKPRQKSLLLYAVEQLLHAEGIRNIQRSRAFRRTVANIVTLALTEGRQALRLAAQHPRQWHDPYGPVEQLIACKVDYLVCALEETSALDEAVAVRLARAALDELRQNMPRYGEPGHISNARIGPLAYLASHSRAERLVDRERVVRLYGLGPSADRHSPAIQRWRHSWQVLRDVVRLMPPGRIAHTSAGPIIRALLRSLNSDTETR